MLTQNSTPIVRVAMLTAVMVLVLSGAAESGGNPIAAQRSPAMNSGRAIDPPDPGLPTNSSGNVFRDGRQEDAATEDRLREQAAEYDRQKRVASEADRLVKLSNELKVDIDKADKNELSMEVIRKAAEIEKLAHDVQIRMKN